MNVGRRRVKIVKVIKVMGCIIPVIVSFVCLIITMNEVPYWKQTKDDTSIHRLCMPCSLLKIDSNLPVMTTLSKLTVKGQEVCCTNNSETASAFIEMLMSSTVNTNDTEAPETYNGEDFSFSKASAHLHLTLATLRSINESVFLEDENMNLEFDVPVTDPLRQHVRNLEVMRTALVVLQPGMYFIYSSIFFKPDSVKPCKSLGKQIWEHNIILTRNGDPDHSGTVFNTTYRCCDECIGNKETSYTGGTIQLLENDHLHVDVSSDGIVSFQKEGSYFGLYMLN